ncbi:hypothetical protein C5E45_34255 [Nocardia nova]|uniref:Uncharacterized protein n=2 Tax=Nocardia nova TaxID=37330 RepID=A0A2S6A7S4_9NOCA|nr:hypothetical protein C5E41_32030 [Nocardia nova]PPJ29044.1 hypothetical protein C5E45_34255 [Nocardia nova]
MTSPDKRVPAGAYAGPAGTGAGLPSLQKLTWQSAQQSIISGVMQSFQGVGAATTNINNATAQAMSAATAAAVGASGAQSTATAAQDTSTANASAIAALQTQQQQTQVGGASVTDNFSSWNTASWATFRSGPVADVSVVNGQAGITKSGNTGNGSVGALWKTPLLTDSESVSVVLGAVNQAGSNDLGSGPVIRAAADLSSFVWAAVSTTSVALGYGVRSGGTTTFTQWVGGSQFSISTGDTITLTAVGNSYTVQINGVGALNYHDTSAVSPVGSTNRWVGFISTYLQQSSAWGTSSYYGFDFDSFAAADTASPPIVGTGWSLYRQNTSSVAQSAGANVLTAPVFDTVRQTNNINLIDLGTGQIQVTKSGWYVISVGFQWDTAAGSNPYWTVLYTAPAAGGTWTAIRFAGEAMGSNQYDTSATFVVFLGAGTVCAPGFQSGQSAGVRGDAGGVATFFDGTLCSFS